MDKKAIQRRRMMGYFINAAKEIIEEEGINALSVRKVGDRAGYSYATIYNYFKDLNTLLFYCIADYLDECYEYIINSFDESEDCRERIFLMVTAYVEYFVKNRNQFQLIFIEDLGEPPKEIYEKISRPSVGFLLSEAMADYAKKGYIESKDVEMLSDLIASSVHGKLLFYLKGRTSIDINKILEILNKELEFLLNKK